MPSNQLAPWHLWGDSKPLAVPPSLATRTSSQLSKIQYNRPDSWTFLFVAKLIAAPVGSASGAFVGVSFDLIIGVGRSMVSLPFFCQFNFSWAAAAAAPAGQLKYSTEARTPLRIQSDPTSFGVIRDFPAQDIQCTGTAIFENGADPGDAIVEMDAYFAPRVHIRPDWYADKPDDQRFRGNEMGGM